jgi:hypothetical protein
MKQLMDKQAAPVTKRHPIQVATTTKDDLEKLRAMYNATYDEVIASLVTFYDTNKGE